MLQLTIQQAFALALQHHQRGQLQEAEPIYRQILAQQPAHADALHLLGVLAYQVGRHDVAVDLIRQAIASQPQFPVAYSNLGNALQQQGRITEAIAAHRQAIALQPDYAEAFCNLGNALLSAEQFDAAILACRQALALKPGFPEACNNLGSALQRKKQLDDAITAFRQTVALNPNYAEAYCNLGAALLEKGFSDEAITALRRAIDLHPKLPEAFANLGKALGSKGRLHEAIAAHRQAIAINPNFAIGHANLGNTLRDNGQLDEADAALREAIKCQPNLAGAHYSLALLLLLRGNFHQGWQEHEWRWRSKDFPSTHPRFPQPLWDGSNLAQGTILIHTEQGFGDSLQFIRYLPLVAARGGQIILWCPAELQRLLQNTPGMMRLLAPDEPLPLTNYHCPLLSLPLALGTTLDNIPRQVPYLQADLAGTDHWRKVLAHDPPTFKVGLAWAGRATHANDRNRSLPLDALAALGQVPGVSFYSLQQGIAAAQAANPPPGLYLTDITADLTDFADTAALLTNLDLVISVDTAVVHLAGALGKPVWTLLPYMPDWRWLLERDDSPWYPTMRLFRQSAAGDWDHVIRQVTKALADLVHARPGENL